jgi:hypothetical protein
MVLVTQESWRGVRMAIQKRSLTTFSNLVRKRLNSAPLPYISKPGPLCALEESKNIFSSLNLRNFVPVGNKTFRKLIKMELSSSGHASVQKNEQRRRGTTMQVVKDDDGYDRGYSIDCMEKPSWYEHAEH